MFKNEQLTEEMLGLEKFAFKLTANKHDADDLLQSTILRAIEKKHLFQEGTDLFKWSSKIMYNLFVSNYRRKVKYETKNDPEDYISKQYVEAPQDSQIEPMQVKEAIEQLSWVEHLHNEHIVRLGAELLSDQEILNAYIEKYGINDLLT